MLCELGHNKLYYRSVVEAADFLLRNISISHYQGQDFSVYVHYTQAKTGTGHSNREYQSHVSTEIWGRTASHWRSNCWVGDLLGPSASRERSWHKAGFQDTGVGFLVGKSND